MPQILGGGIKTWFNKVETPLHAEVVSASYFLLKLRIKALKQVQDDGSISCLHALKSSP